MKGITEVKVFTFKGEDAEDKCEDKVNEGIENGWQPVGFSSYVLDGQKVIKVMMGNTKEPKKKEPEEEEKDEVVKEETLPPSQPAPEEEIEPEKSERTEEVEEEEQKETQEALEPKVEETVEETPPPSTEKKDTDTRSQYEKCPRCGNMALEVEIDHSAHCDYCGFIVRDIKKIREKQKDEE